jgi:hypothetical protein
MTPREVARLEAQLLATARHPRGDEQKRLLARYLTTPTDSPTDSPKSTHTSGNAGVHPSELDARRQALSDAYREDMRQLRHALASVTLTGQVTRSADHVLDTSQVPDRSDSAVCRVMPGHGPDRPTASETVSVAPINVRAALSQAARLASVAAATRREDQLSYEAWLDGGRREKAASCRGAPSGMAGVSYAKRPEHGPALDSPRHTGGKSRNSRPETTKSLASGGAPSGWSVRRGKVSEVTLNARQRRARRRRAEREANPKK